MSRTASLATKLKVLAFADHHKSDFEKALAQTEAAERGFPYAAREFDEWAVAEGLMDQALEDVPKEDKAARAGVLHQRHQVRFRLNRCALMWNGQPSRFAIRARNGVWRVVLVEQFLVEQPKEVLYNIREAFSRAQYSLEQVQVLLKTRVELSNKEIALCVEQAKTAIDYVSEIGMVVDTMLRKTMVGKISPIDSMRLLNLSRPKRAIM